MPKTEKQPTTLKWDEYVREAEIPPVTLEVADGEPIEFTAPTGVALIRIMRGLRDGDIEAILIALCGDEWPRMEKLLGGAHHPAFPAITEDLMDLFKLYEDITLVGPGGGKVTERRPTKIQKLLNMGYRPLGEADSRT
jgi:hypothetical protein